MTQVNGDKQCVIDISNQMPQIDFDAPTGLHAVGYNPKKPAGIKGILEKRYSAGDGFEGPNALVEAFLLEENVSYQSNERNVTPECQIGNYVQWSRDRNPGMYRDLIKNYALISIKLISSLLGLITDIETSDDLLNEIGRRIDCAVLPSDQFFHSKTDLGRYTFSFTLGLFEKVRNPQYIVGLNTELEDLFIRIGRYLEETNSSTQLSDDDVKLRIDAMRQLSELLGLNIYTFDLLLHHFNQNPELLQEN